LAIYINIINKRPIYTCAPPGDDKKSHSDLLRNPEKLEKPGPVQLLATDPTKTNATMQPIAEDCFPKKMSKCSKFNNYCVKLLKIYPNC
jgi:hypothetical protein